ncbi:MAG: hypothetical protein US57_C0002G0040 [Candidatus Moranbacteria bacterium GW2011_GWC2_37_73]|nr:MAG: hypothetical protein UR95_C0002G0138 [Parcubacteria group bacterium GW2011_GWC1_36_108]KKQ01019.1 MAG: hypothetical protein US09_C0003G0019 [Candidatus Moranbacteria bacterium GW2011_GWD1_36_198]KKQ02421.1 MAG: hypothetical protein US10_C0001G0019 [Candidatus Moranbacteria bacterium GW2011_GWD2_36_198]KKQ40333.1 MAG: hypothetical protein US57_C0002G0040 [Candidatus Moranbacteria bacterium GW2011_GWC2_37_73]HAS00158.1 hypothetical protein [Candidatus Moranbacteria bacterium]
MAKKELSQDEQRFINEVIGPQLQKSEHVKIPINLNSYLMNYCTISNGDPISFIDVIVLVCGFGSGWTGSSLLGYELVKLGYQVTMVSLLGYGNSNNPPMLARNNFKRDAVALHIWANKVLPGRNIHWIGHSMGAAVITELAVMSPRTISSLTLLDPIGFQKRSMLELGLKFIANGIGHKWAFSGNPKWEVLEKFLPKEKSPFTSDRIKQRLCEWEKLCDDKALTSLKKVLNIKMVQCIYGEKDSLFRHALDCDGIIYVPLPLWHNTTMHGSDLTAKEIDKFIFNLIK